MHVKQKLTAIGLTVLGLMMVSPAWAIEWLDQPRQGSLMRGKVEPGHAIRFHGEPVRVTEDGAFVIGFSREADLDQKVVEVTSSGERIVHPLTLQEREYDIQRIEGVPQRTVTPDPKNLKRIRAEAALVRKARKTDSDLTFFTDAFIWPAQGPITGVYGSQRVYNGEPRRPHYGVDIAAPKGAPVVAPAPGTVTLVHDNMFFSGGTLLIDHGYGVSSTFIHMDEVLVEEGQHVEQGDLIGRVGEKGRATGPHLDWRMNWYDVRVDPSFLAPPLDHGKTPQTASAE
ncbi:peptidoglycan DD-metalloendopeptidase family protein [Marinobacteraceae bacterium S3BR75-40.1]